MREDFFNLPLRNSGSRVPGKFSTGPESADDGPSASGPVVRLNTTLMRNCAALAVLAFFWVDASAQLKDTTVLKKVEVTGRKPLIEQKVDRTVINVDAAVTNTGQTVLEVLSKLPGVTVDKDGNISLKGKAGVLVMLDGKPTYLSGTDLSNMLESMNANQLDQIELMTNPPAQFDAAGNAGIINLRTKKNKAKGFNGSLTLGYGQGRYWKTNNSLNLNYRNSKFNLFFNYSANVNHGYTDLHLVRDYVGADGKTVNGIFDGPTYLVRKFANNTAKLGMDYFLSRRTTLGIVTSGMISPRNSYGESHGYPEDASGKRDTATFTRSSNENRVVNGSVNLNLRQTFDSAHELTVDADYIQYSTTNPQWYTNTMYSPGGALTDSAVLRGDLPSTIRIGSGKADYTQKLAGGWKLGVGWKSSLVTTDNVANYFDGGNGSWTPDYGKTNHFLYRENINAAYLNIDGVRGKWTLQAGLRYENTHYTGHQLGNPLRADSSFTRMYNDLFPTVFVSYQANAGNQFTISTGRRIDRPAYQQLDPFFFFINSFTFQTGNPFLVPQYTTNIELSHIYKGVLTTTLSYSNTANYFTEIFRSTGDTTMLTFGNLARQRYVGLSMSASVNFNSWWSATLHGEGGYKHVDGFANGQVIRTDGVSGQLNVNNQFRWKGGWSGELSGFYNTKDVEGQFVTEPFGQVSTGMAKQVLSGKGTVKVNLADVFFTSYVRGEILYQNVREHYVQKRDSRVVNVAFSWRFGKTFKETGSRRQGGAGEEQKRVNL